VRCPSIRQLPIVPLGNWSRFENHPDQWSGFCFLPATLCSHRCGIEESTIACGLRRTRRSRETSDLEWPKSRYFRYDKHLGTVFTGFRRLGNGVCLLKAGHFQPLPNRRTQIKALTIGQGDSPGKA
jgi:hypothetical protein